MNALEQWLESEAEGLVKVGEAFADSFYKIAKDQSKEDVKETLKREVPATARATGIAAGAGAASGGTAALVSGAITRREIRKTLAEAKGAIDSKIMKLPKFLRPKRLR